MSNRTKLKLPEKTTKRGRRWRFDANSRETIEERFKDSRQRPYGRMQNGQIVRL